MGSLGGQGNACRGAVSQRMHMPCAITLCKHLLCACGCCSWVQHQHLLLSPAQRVSLAAAKLTPVSTGAAMCCRCVREQCWVCCLGFSTLCQMLQLQQQPGAHSFCLRRLLFWSDGMHATLQLAVAPRCSFKYRRCVPIHYATQPDALILLHAHAHT